MTAVMNDFILAQVNSTAVTRSRICYVNISDDATYCGIIKSRLEVCDAKAASWTVGSSPLTVLMFLYPAAARVALALHSSFRFVLESWVGLRED